MGIFGKQMQLIDSIYEIFDSSVSLILISSMYANLNPKYKNHMKTIMILMLYFMEQ